jgi:hypothetical protein
VGLGGVIHLVLAVGLGVASRFKRRCPSSTGACGPRSSLRKITRTSTTLRAAFRAARFCRIRTSCWVRARDQGSIVACSAHVWPSVVSTLRADTSNDSTAAANLACSSSESSTRGAASLTLSKHCPGSRATSIKHGLPWLRFWSREGRFSFLVPQNCLYE